jgi:hypothetical protein
MGTLYEDDIIAWAAQQAALLRRGQWSELDIDNIAEEIEDVGKSEKRELQSRQVVLVTHLLTWRCQPGRRGNSWHNTIKEQRAAIAEDLVRYPHLKPLLDNPQWLRQIYRRAKLETELQTHLQDLPEEMPWDVEQLLSQHFLPE